jgi:hypothetical protein
VRRLGTLKLKENKKRIQTAEGSTRGHSTINAVNILNSKFVSLQQQTQSIFFWGGQIRGYLHQTQSHLIGKTWAFKQQSQSHFKIKIVGI